MTEGYPSALMAIEQTLGSSPRERVKRAYPHCDGGLVLELDDGTWLLFRSGSLETLRPTDDTRLPITEMIAERGHPRIFAWRPARRIVIGLADEDRVYKGYRRGKGARALARHRVMAGKLEGGLLRPAKILGFDEDREVICFSRARGQHPRLEAASVNTFYRLGHGLRGLQRTAASGLPEHGRSAELGVLAQWSKIVHSLSVEPPAGWDEEFQRVCSMGERWSEGPLAPAHRDLHDGQLLVHQGCITLLDFDLAALAEPELDVGNLIAHLSLRELQAGRSPDSSIAESLSEALLDGLEPHNEDALRTLRFYQATTFLRLALVYLLRPRWEHITKTLLVCARRSLDELEVGCA